MPLGAKAHAGNLESGCECGGGGKGRERGNSWRRQVWLPRKMRILARSHRATDIKGRHHSSESAKQPAGRTKGTCRLGFCSGQSLRWGLLEILYTKRNPLQDLGLEFPLIKRPPKSQIKVCI